MRPKDPDTFWLIASFVVAVMAGASAAKGHSWYSYDCCADHDCKPIEAVTETDKGYAVMGQLIPYGDKRLRVSQDAQFHVCQPFPPAIQCLYVPGRSF